jgi:1-acyl-sn-glycerol-3-phosphate acyltransferase
LRLLLANRVLRRIVTVPVLILGFVWVLGLFPVWLLVAAFLAQFLPGRWRVLRLTWFALVYMALEVAALIVLFALWIGTGFGLRIGTERSIGLHHRVLAGFLRAAMASARFTFGLEVVDAGDPTESSDPSRPLLVFSRHAGAGDSLLLVDAIANGAGRRRPRIVLKSTLQFDPVIDIMLNRVGAAFVGVGPGATGDVVAAIARLAAEAGPGDALVLFPEGGNYTPQRRTRAIERLESSGRPDLARRAEALAHLLPPKPLGVMTAIEAAPTADIAFVGHVGLEPFSSPLAVWHNLPTSHTVTARVWRVPAEDIPPAEGRERWLYDQWQQIDDWIAETIPAQRS